jgi:hypothetical protein
LDRRSAAGIFAGLPKQGRTFVCYDPEGAGWFCGLPAILLVVRGDVKIR